MLPRSSSFLAWLILRGRVGRAFRAVRDSEIAAAASGVEIGLYKTLAFGISAAFCGVAGALFVMASNGFAQPDEFSVVLSLAAPRSASPLPVSARSGGSSSALRSSGSCRTSRRASPFSAKSHGQDVVYGFVVILVMLVLPGGFAGLFAKLRLRVEGLNPQSNAVKLPKRSS